MQISWWTLAIQGVNFLVLVWLLQRFLYEPVRRIVEKRRQERKEAASAAEMASNEAKALKQRYEKALANIAAERDAVLAKAHEASEAERSKLLEEARRSVAEREKKEQEAIEQERTAALDALRDDVADLAARMARTILADLARSIPNDAVLTRLESELARIPPAERERLESEIVTNGDALAVITARALEPAEQRDWQSRLEKALKHPLHVRFEEDPALLSGAVLRLPHTSVRATWADQVEEAREALRREGDDELSR